MNSEQENKSAYFKASFCFYNIILCYYRRKIWGTVVIVTNRSCHIFVMSVTILHHLLFQSIVSIQKMFRNKNGQLVGLEVVRFGER